MKKKEIQVELNEKIYQLIDKLHEIPEDIIKNESEWIKRNIKNGYTLENSLIVCIKDLTSKAIDDINNT